MWFRDSTPCRSDTHDTFRIKPYHIAFALFATHALDIGAMSVFLYCFREREYVLDLIEKYCGARLTHSSMRIGGVMLDLPENYLEEMLAFCDNFQMI